MEGDGDEQAVQVVSLLDRLSAESMSTGPVWTCTSPDLNVNLVQFRAGQGISAHRNDEVDVLIVGVSGEGLIEVAGKTMRLRAGDACVVPKGTVRSLHAASDRFGYITCHRRRAGLMPA